MSCNYNIYGCYTCCYKFKVSDTSNWNLSLCPKCGEPTVTCIHKALKIMNREGCGGNNNDRLVLIQKKGVDNNEKISNS